MFLMLLGWFVGLLILLFNLAWMYKEMTMGVCKSTKSLVGKTVIVTGGNAGIGFETAKDLARRGATLILACRSKERGTAAVKKIVSETGNKKVELRILDLGSFQSVRDFAKDINHQVGQVDILVNNAGILPVEQKLSEDDLDLVLQTNHFSHFLLSHLLKEKLEKSSDPRIINVSSCLKRNIGNPDGKIDYDSIKKGAVFERRRVYHVSKFMNALFSQQIARKWGGSGIKSYSVHPGIVRTEIMGKAEAWTKSKMPKILKFVIGHAAGIVGLLYGKSLIQGAQTTLYCCLEDGLTNGQYFADCKPGVWYLKNPNIHEPRLADQLWKFSIQIVGL